MTAPVFTVADAVDRYMAQYSGRDHALTYRLSTFVAHLGPDRALAEVTNDDVREVLKKLRAQPARYYAGKDADGRPILKARGPRSVSTLRRYVQSFASLCSWAIEECSVPKGWINPCKGIKGLKEPRGRVRFLDDEERARLLAAVRASSWDRLYPLVLLAITTGARRGEIARLTWADIDLARALASVHVTKNGHPRVLPLVPAVVELLTALRKQDARRFDSVGRRLVFHSPRRPDQAFEFTPAWHKALAAAKIDNFRFHDLRHCCASYLAQQGASLLEVADVLGHKSMAMVQRYAHLSTGSKAALVNRVLGDIR